MKLALVRIVELEQKLQSLIALIAEVHDTHIYAPDDPHPDDCRYCKAAAEASKVLANV